MRKFAILFLFGSLITLTGCLDVVEEIYLNRDGSGKYMLKLDMSSLFSDPFMKSMMEQAMEQEGVTRGEGNKLEQDTVIYLKDMPDSVRRGLDRPEFWENVVMRMTMSESQKKMVTTIELPFKQLSDITYFFENIDQLGAGENMGAGGMLGGGMLGATASYQLSGKNFTRSQSASALSDQNDDDMQMLKMFLSSATYKTIYHMPGKVRKTTIPNADIDNNTVTVETGYLDMLDGKAKLDGQIKFK